MSETVIKVKNLSKKYYIGINKSGSLRESLVNKWNILLGKEDREIEEFWALKDINFEVKQGEVLGIIGKNGAGKTTILKILSRITEPTTGRIEINGRVSSLLEVGTGFHPELTGRENIFLNGTILGMSRNEVKSKFDEIVDFSGIEKFLDTPVKRYSSGMYVRLAFSVAAHLEPEILIIDEVLAVGDAEFQKKCLGKMKDVSKSGRTILFVSHQMGSIVKLCKKGIFLHNGSIKMIDKINIVVNSYLNNEVATKDRKFVLAENKILPKFNQIISFVNRDELGNERTEYVHNEQIIIDCSLQLNDYNPNLEFAISLYDSMKRRVFTIHEPLYKHYKNNKAKFKIIIPANFIAPGNYSWLMCINHPGICTIDLKDDICSFQIIDNGSIFSNYEGADYGCVFVDYKVIDNY